MHTLYADHIYDYHKKMNIMATMQTKQQQVVGQSGSSRKGHFYLFAICLLLLPLSLAGCATGGSVGRLLPNMGNMYVAQHYFGPPQKSKTLENGTVSHEWSLDRTVLEPPHYTTRRVYLGHDRDGFPVYEDVEVFVNERLVHQYCRIRLIVDSEGRILHSNMEGPSCEALLRVPTTY